MAAVPSWKFSLLLPVNLEPIQILLLWGKVMPKKHIFALMNLWFCVIFWVNSKKKSFINPSVPWVGRGDGGVVRRLQGCRLKHTLLTRSSQTGEEARKPQGDEEIFEVTLRTSLKPFSHPKAKMGLYCTFGFGLTVSPLMTKYTTQQCGFRAV